MREAHNDTSEGLWTGLRNSLRPFRGVSKEYLGQYVAIFEWGRHIKRVTPEFLRAMLGVPSPDDRSPMEGTPAIHLVRSADPPAIRRVA